MGAGDLLGQNLLPLSQVPPPSGLVGEWQAPQPVSTLRQVAL